MLPLFEIYRACVRIKIDILQAQEADHKRKVYLESRIKAYQSLIEERLEGKAMEKRILVFYGLPATGKSRAAREAQKELQLPVLSTDRLRKKILGCEPDQKLPESAYSKKIGRRVYQRQAALARQTLKRSGVILDGVFPEKTQRERIRRLAKRTQARLEFSLCKATEEEIKQRLQRRKDGKNISDLIHFSDWKKIQKRFEAD